MLTTTRLRPVLCAGGPFHGQFHRVTDDCDRFKSPPSISRFAAWFTLSPPVVAAAQDGIWYTLRRIKKQGRVVECFRPEVARFNSRGVEDAFQTALQKMGAVGGFKLDTLFEIAVAADWCEEHDDPLCEFLRALAGVSSK